MIDTTLTLVEEYGNQLERQVELTLLYQEDYYTEGLNPAKTLERIVLLIDQFFVNVANVISIHKKQNEVERYMKRLDRLKNTLTEKEFKRMMLVQLPAISTPITVDDEIQLIRNIFAIYKIKPGGRVDKLRTANIQTLLRPSGEEFKKTRGTVYYVNLAFLSGMVKETEKDLSKLQEASKDLLFQFNTLPEQIEGKTLKDTAFGKFVKSLVSVIKQHTLCALYNMSAFVDGLKFSTHKIVDKETLDRIHAYDKLSDKERIEKYEKNAKFIKTVTVEDQNFQIYQLDIPAVSCYNRSGTHIYVDSTFFTHSIAHQKAIIWHEIGHTMAGHFGLVGNNIPDEEKRIRRMKWDMIQFQAFKNDTARFKHSDDELVYLLCEWEADRYAAKHAGKYNMKKSLMDDAKVGFFASIVKDPKHITDKEAMILAYNKERMKLRTQLM